MLVGRPQFDLGLRKRRRHRLQQRPQLFLNVVLLLGVGQGMARTRHLQAVLEAHADSPAQLIRRPGGPVVRPSRSPLRASPVLVRARRLRQHLPQLLLQRRRDRRVASDTRSCAAGCACLQALRCCSVWPSAQSTRRNSLSPRRPATAVWPWLSSHRICHQLRSFGSLAAR